MTLAIVDVRIHHGRTTEYIHTFPLIVYRMRYDDWKSNSCRIIQLYHVFLRNTGDILVIFWYFFLYSTRLKARGIQKKIPKNFSNIHRYFIKTHGITGNYPSDSDVARFRHTSKRHRSFCHVRPRVKWMYVKNYHLCHARDAMCIVSTHFISMYK